MAELDDDVRPGPITYVGCGCGCLGGLLGLGGVLLLVAVLLGVFEPALEGRVTTGASSTICVGIVVGLVGLVLYVVGNRPRAS